MFLHRIFLPLVAHKTLRSEQNTFKYFVKPTFSFTQQVHSPLGDLQPPTPPCTSWIGLPGTCYKHYAAVLTLQLSCWRHLSVSSLLSSDIYARVLSSIRVLVLAPCVHKLQSVVLYMGVDTFKQNKKWIATLLPVRPESTDSDSRIFC